MAHFLDRVLEQPSYGYERDGKFYVPTGRELAREFFSRINVFKDLRNWAPLACWTLTFILVIPLVIFFVRYFSWPLFAAAFVYSMVVLGTHGTIYYHRYATHRAYQFSHPIWRFITHNLVVKIIPEEIYVISHHVHHHKSEQPGDPYNVHGGWWYCFLADVIHQPISKSLTRDDYRRVAGLLDHTAVKANTYEQYLRWGSIAHPLPTLTHFALNWVFWYTIFYFIGGHGLALALFGAAGFWGFGVRTFNFSGHGSGKDLRGKTDFDRRNLSINQLWPGLVTGEWHNNHHLYPNGVRAGFLPHQLDYAWYYIWALNKVGGIKSWRDYKPEFMKKHYLPYLAGQAPPLLPESI